MRSSADTSLGAGAGAEVGLAWEPVETRASAIAERLNVFICQQLTGCGRHAKRRGIHYTQADGVRGCRPRPRTRPPSVPEIDAQRGRFSFRCANSLLSAAETNASNNGFTQTPEQPAKPPPIEIRLSVRIGVHIDFQAIGAVVVLQLTGQAGVGSLTFGIGWPIAHCASRIRSSDALPRCRLRSGSATSASRRASGHRGFQQRSTTMIRRNSTASGSAQCDGIGSNLGLNGVTNAVTFRDLRRSPAALLLAWTVSSTGSLPVVAPPCRGPAKFPAPIARGPPWPPSTPSL